MIGWCHHFFYIFFSNTRILRSQGSLMINESLFILYIYLVFSFICRFIFFLALLDSLELSSFKFRISRTFGFNTELNYYFFQKSKLIGDELSFFYTFFFSNRFQFSQNFKLMRDVFVYNFL